MTRLWSSVLKPESSSEPGSKPSSKPGSRLLAALLLLFVPWLLASRCGGGDGGGGSAAFHIESPDRRCIALVDPVGFPPGFDFVPEPAGAPLRVLAATTALSNLIPIGIESLPFGLAPGSTSYALEQDADSDGQIEFFKSIGRVEVVDDSLALIGVSGQLEGVVFVDPGGVGPVEVDVRIPIGFDPALFVPFAGLPAPGQSRIQTGINVSACIVPPPGALDSFGETVVSSVPPAFTCDGPGSFPAGYTAGVQLVGDRLFAAVSNLGAAPGTENTQFLPGAVVVYRLERSFVPARITPELGAADGRPYLLTSGFNPTSLTPHTTAGGRRLLLVTLTGAIGIRADDPSTEALESGALRITEGAIDVIDVDALELVATIPLQLANPGYDPIAIDPSGRVGLFGDVGSRSVYAIDLASLETLPAAGSSGLPVLLGDAVIFDGRNPLEIPALVGGAPPSSCPGRIAGIAFADVGSHAFALETCDGSLATLEVDLVGAPTTAELRSRIGVSGVFGVTAPLRVDTFDLFRSPSALAVRPGRPGIDYQGPDVFFLVGEPRGLLCGIRIDSR